MKKNPSPANLGRGSGPDGLNESLARSVWVEHGLARRRFSIRRPPLQPQKVKARQLRLALERLGGPFLLFGRHLAGRGDLLPISHLAELQKIPLPTARQDAPAPFIDAGLEDVQLIRSTPFGRTWMGSFQNRRAVIETAPDRDEFTKSEWRAFYSGIRMLDSEPETNAAGDRVLEEFRHWIRLQIDPARKKKTLERISDASFQTCWKFPEIASALELSEDRGFAYFTSAADAPKAGDSERDVPGALGALMEGLIELPLLFSAIPAEVQHDDLVLTADGRVTFRIWPAMAAIPAERHHELLQYVTCLLSEDRSRAAYYLLRMVKTLNPELSAFDLRQELAAGILDLDAINRLPDSAQEMLQSWKALRNSGADSPQFLQLFHRYVLLNGFWNGAKSEEDLLPEAVWPVLGRLVSLRISENLSTEKAGEWAMGSALGLLSTARQWSASLEELRDRESAPPADSSRNGPSPRGRDGVVFALLFLAFIPLSIQVALHNAGTPWEIAFVLLGGMALFGLLFVVMRTGG